VERVTGWRLAIRHTTTSRYAGEVFASYNEARLTPLRGDGQGMVEANVTVEPAAVLHTYRDYWGTTVHTFDVQRAHKELTVVGTSVVDSRVLAETVDATWDDLSDDANRDAGFEYLAPTPVTTSDASLRAVARELRGASARPIDAVRAAIDGVRAHVRYERGVTTVSTSAAEAWARGRGVCQDFAHVTLALLRAMGIPARYVSGYVHPEPDALIGETVSGESHAWVEAWTGDWTAFDPTLGVPAAERHVMVARARDYSDVAPMRGIYTGAAVAGQDVTVEVTRLA
jgi:transglutaminase-like putative cysteine protease